MLLRICNIAREDGQERGLESIARPRQLAYTQSAAAQRGASGEHRTYI